MMESYVKAVQSRAAQLFAEKAGAYRLVLLQTPELAFPHELLTAPVLGPVDRNVWMAIKMSAVAGGKQVLDEDGRTVRILADFPGYTELVQRCNVGGKAAISRSLSVLRSTRWLTLGGDGIYRLNDGSMSLDEAVLLDSSYPRWLQETAAGQHSRHHRSIAVASREFDYLVSQAESPLLKPFLVIPPPIPPMVTQLHGVTEEQWDAYMAQMRARAGYVRDGGRPRLRLVK